MKKVSIVLIDNAVMYILSQAEVYSGAIFIQQLLGLNLYVCVVVILGVTAIYTVAGRLPL